MGSLYVCLNVYREARLLPGCLESIRTAAPHAKIVAVDGAYENFVRAAKRCSAMEIENGHHAMAELFLKYTAPKSDDGTLEILRAAGAHVIETEMPWEHEYLKRSQYFVGKTGDWYLVMDADERLMGKVPEDLSHLQDEVYNLMLSGDDADVPYHVLRFQKHIDGMCYQGAHHALHTNGKLWKKDSLKTVGGLTANDIARLVYMEKLSHEPFWLHHLRIGRGKDLIRAHIRASYYRHLTGVEEGEFRALHSL